MPSSRVDHYQVSRLILLAGKLLREQDSLMLTELHPTDFPLLRTEFSRDERVRDNVQRQHEYQDKGKVSLSLLKTQ